MTKCILVIDDEDSLRELACTCIEDLGGWTAIEAASGQEGLHQAQAYAPDAILLDVSMPQMDGFEFHTHLKANPITQALPVIFLTAKVLPDDRAKFAEMDIAGFITKPFDPTLLCDQIADLLNWAD
jgi:CheY-like chemotaxis protein